MKETFKKEQANVKLAGNVNRRGRDAPLVPLDPEREDSGIDSDDAIPIQCREERDSSDGGNSDIDHGVISLRPVKNPGALWNAVPDAPMVPSVMMKMMPWQYPRGGQDLLSKDQYGKCPQFDENDRDSPPLYEVELTASDEDDDASVLELVIPMQTSRYHRVPTSSPKKIMNIAPSFLCNMLCCMRK